MCPGDVKIKKCETFLVANKQGFASMYALAIIQIVLAFVLLLLSSSKTMIANKKINTDLHNQQLFALYHVKAYLNQEEDTQVSDEEVEGEENVATQEEYITYRNQEIHITYQATQVEIVIAHLQMQLEIDEESKNIINLVYL